jgi:hypothetical protein
MNINFSAKMLNVCWFGTLRELGFKTHLSIHNPLPKLDLTCQSLFLTLTLYSKDGLLLSQDLDLGELRPKERRVIQVDEILSKVGIHNDVTGVLHKTPSEFRGLDVIQVPLREIQQWTSVTDDFVGYTHIGSQVNSGVQYQSPPMNDARLPSSSTTLMHSSKVYVDDNSDTLLMLLTPSSSNLNMPKINFKLRLIETETMFEHSFSLVLDGRARRLFSLKEHFMGLGRNCKIDPIREGLLIGVSTNGSVAPFTLLSDSRGGLAIDHTLPPVYYAPWWNTDSRKRTSQFFSTDSNLFDRHTQ